MLGLNIRLFGGGLVKAGLCCDEQLEMYIGSLRLGGTLEQSPHTLCPGTSGLGQQRKSAKVAGMSAPGGKADFDSGRPDVCF
jgi:hypothetical protein